jgi:hypothetical protein
MDPEVKSKIAACIGITINVCSVNGVVLLNKYIYDVDGFKFMITLTAIHFGFTALMTRFLLWADFFEFKEPEGCGLCRHLAAPPGHNCCRCHVQAGWERLSRWPSGRWCQCAS